MKNNSNNLWNNVIDRYKTLRKRNKKNLPSLTRQVKLLLHIYEGNSSKPQQLFAAAGLTAITGFRYAAKLRKFDFITCSGRGTGCYYGITDTGIQFLKGARV